MRMCAHSKMPFDWYLSQSSVFFSVNVALFICDLISAGTHSAFLLYCWNAFRSLPNLHSLNQQDSLQSLRLKYYLKLWNTSTPSVLRSALREKVLPACLCVNVSTVTGIVWC